MMGGSETVSGDKDGVHTTAIHVPIGWQRRVEGGQVIYVSPSGTALSSLDEVKTYLLTDGTCKCGLECPLIIHKVFSFTVGVKVEQHSQPLGRTEQDMTKLCNHRRKVVAMAALCRSMQASQLPFTNLHHAGTRDPNGALVREEEGRGLYHPKLHPVPSRSHNNFHSNPCASPKSPHQFMYPHNGSSPVLHTGTNPHHPLDTLRRLHHPPSLPASATSSSSSTFTSYSSAQRSPRTPTPQNVSQGQRTPKTPETPGSPRLRPLSPPPPSSPMPLGGGGRGGQTHTHHPHGVIVGGSSPSLSPSLSPSVHNMNCVSPHRRTRHPSASPSPLSEQGGASAAAEGQMGSNLSQRRKSSSSSPHSPLPGGSPNPSPHFAKYKLEDILEQLKNSGNSSTNNNHLLNPNSPSLLTNQSSSNIHALSSKPSKSIMSQTSSTGLPGFGLNSAGPSSLPLGAFLNHHHSHQGKMPHPASFPASNLLSAAAKAQLANQITQGQGSNVASNPASLPSSLDVLKEAQQHQSSKVTNSTLHNNHPPSSTASRPPHPSLAASLASSLPHLPPTVERNASHRKRQRRSPTVLSMLRDTQQLANGPQKTPPGGEAVSVTTAHLSRPPRQNEALDFTTGLRPAPLGLDPPTQPLSALLHLLSVQNAQATTSASNSASTQPGSVSVEGIGHTNRQSPRLSPSSPATHSNSRHPQSPCRTNDTNSLPLVPQPLSPPPTPSQFRSSQSHTHSRSTRSSPLQTHSSTMLPNSNVALPNSSRSPSQHMSPSPSDKPQPTENHVPTIDSVSQEPLQEASQEGPVRMEMGSHDASTSPGCVDPKVSTVTKPPAAVSPGPDIATRLGDHNHTPNPSALGDSTTPSPLAEAFPFMNQEQLLQLLSSTGGLPSLLDPTVLASLPLGGLWLGGQHAQMPPANATLQTPQNLAEQHSPLFPLLPLLSGAQGEFPLNLLGLLNPLPPPASTPTPGQEADLGLTEKPTLQALLMASLLLGQHQAPLIPLSSLGQLSQVSLEVPLQQPQQIPTTLEGLTLDKVTGLLDPSTLTGPGLLEIAQGLLPILPGAEGTIQALQSLLLPTTLPPPSAAFLPLSPALLTAALSSAELHPPPHTQLAPAQQTQHTQPQVGSPVPTDAGVDTLIPLSLQGKDNPILQHLLPTLLNPAVLGELVPITCNTSFSRLKSVCSEKNFCSPSSMQETQSPALQQDIPTSQIAPDVVPSPAPAQPPGPAPAHEPTQPPRESEGRSVIDPYTSFMDTIYTSFLQVSAKEQEDGHHTPSAPVPTLPQASAPVSLSPRRACSLRNPDLSRLSLEAAAHSPAQGTPKPSEDGSTSPLQRKPGIVEGHTHPEPPMPPIYLEEAKTDCFVEAGGDRQGHLPHSGYLSPMDGCSLRPNEETAGTLLHTEQGRVSVRVFCFLQTRAYFISQSGTE
uniref:MBD domain-containing protein n=1 Tax=Scophthalmus maximus TaxID=52904 RepID=A0A8D3AXV1_SCOMX